MRRGFLTTNIQLLCILISVLISSCTSTFQGKLIEAHTEINEDPYSSSFVSLGAEGDCVVFRLPFAGGVDKALKVTLSVEGYRSRAPNVKYLAISAPNYGTFLKFFHRSHKHNTSIHHTHTAGQIYNNSIDSYQQCSVYFRDETCWAEIPHMASVSFRSSCGNMNLARLGTPAFASIDLTDRYSHYVDELNYEGKVQFYFLGSDIEKCETFAGDYLIFVKGVEGRSSNIRLKVEDAIVSMYCWASSPEAWAIMWTIVLLPFILFAICFRIAKIREYCKNQVAPDALAVNETNGDEPVHAGVPVGSPKPIVEAQIAQNDEETSKDMEEDDDVPVVSPVQRVSTRARVMSLIRAAVPRTNSARIYLEAECDNNAYDVDADQDMSVGTRVARYGAREATDEPTSSTGDVTSNGSSTAMFL